MSQHTAANSDPANGPGYETTDVQVGAISKFIVGLVLLMVVGGVLGFISYKLLDFRQKMTYADMKATPMQEKRVVPPGPLLQVTNHDDLLTFREEEAEKVNGHATWADKGKNAKIVRLPIDRAIELVSQRGLPVFKAESAPAGSTPATGEGKK
jgi:hypothetical protein